MSLTWGVEITEKINNLKKNKWGRKDLKYSNSLHSKVGQCYGIFRYDNINSLFGVVQVEMGIF